MDTPTILSTKFESLHLISLKKQHTKVCSLAGGLYGVHCDFGVTRSN